MEFLGVTLATTWLIIVFFYYTVFSTVLNVVIAILLTRRLTNNKGWLLGIMCFVTLSLALTFVTRAPDFLTDALGDYGYQSQISRRLNLVPGDTVNIPERYPAIEHRSSYFGTSGYEDVETSTGIGGPNFYTEDFIYHLRGKGLRLNFGPKEPDGVTLELEVHEGLTHQKLVLKVEHGNAEIARFAGSERKHFLDEVGAGTFRHHLLHTTKNSLWNWIIRIKTNKTSHPVTNFLDQVIEVGDRVPEIQSFDVVPDSRIQPLLSFNYESLGNSGSEQFDCMREDAPFVSSNRLRSRIDSEFYELDLSWPIGAMQAEASTYLGKPRIVRIACGAEGYMAWIAGKPGFHRVVLTDGHWRIVAALDVVVPELQTTSARSLNALNFYQQADSLILEAHFRNTEPLPDESGGNLVAFKLTHSILKADYGSQASRLTGNMIWTSMKEDRTLPK